MQTFSPCTPATSILESSHTDAVVSDNWNIWNITSTSSNGSGSTQNWHVPHESCEIRNASNLLDQCKSKEQPHWLITDKSNVKQAPTTLLHHQLTGHASVALTSDSQMFGSVVPHGKLPKDKNVESSTHGGSGMHGKGTSEHHHTDHIQ